VQTSFRLATACILIVALLIASGCTSIRSQQSSAAPVGPHGPALETPRPAPTPIGLRASIARLPLGFEPNVGHAPADVRFIGRAAGIRVELTEQGVRLVATRTGAEPRVAVLRLIGASATARIAGEDELPGKVQYFAANVPSGWRTNIPTYAQVVYRGVYPGIDLVFHGTEGKLEFDFVVAPGADARAIALDVADADAIARDGGDVVLHVGDDTLRLHEPIVYQESAAGRVRAVGRMKVDGRRIAFDVGEYDRTRPLVIDPVVTYATYYGGSTRDNITGVGIDGSGNIYAAVSGDSRRVIKLSPDGQTLLYTTLLGDMAPVALTVDTVGNAYMAATCAYPRSGITFNCPTLGSLASGHAQSQGDSGAYVLKLSPGGVLLFSTSLGGVGSVEPNGIAVDAAGNMYTTAWDVYGGFPLTQPPFSRPDVTDGYPNMIAAIAADYSRFLWVASFRAGSDVIFRPRALAVDRTSAVYIAGTAGTAFPTTSGALQPTTGSEPGAGIVAKISPDGSTLLYSTYFGARVTSPTAIAVDGDGNAYIAGRSGIGLPTANALQPAMAGGLSDAFVARLNPAGSALVFSTYLGGGGDDSAWALTLDSSANVYVAGSTTSVDFPQQNPLPTPFGGTASNFVTELTSDGGSLVYSTYFGDTQTSVAALTATPSGIVYLGGSTRSASFPTVRPYQPTFGGGDTDGFIAKLEPSEVRVFVTSPDDGATVSGTVWTDVWAENYVGTSNTFTLSVGGTVLATGTANNHATLAWDSRSIPDGSITLTATVRDSAGHVGVATRNLIVRNGTAPSLTAAFTSPAAGATVSGVVAVGMSETGASGTPITFTLTVDGTQVFTAAGTATAASFNWDTSTVAAGGHTLGLSVRDGAGHVATATRSVTVAGTPSLTAAFTSPAEGATVTGTVAVGMSASGASGTPITFTLTFDGTQLYTTSGTATTASFNWDTTTVSTGLHQLALTVRDGAGRTAGAVRNITVARASTQTLAVYITSPSAGSTVSGTVWSDIWVEKAVTGSRTFTLSIGGTTLVSAGDPTNHVTLPWDSTRVANGTQTLVATVTDAAGNRGTGTLSLNIQNAGGGPAPLTASFTAPTEGASVSGNVTVGMSETGASGTPIAFTLTVDGTQVFATSGSAASASFTWNTTSVADGAHTLGLTVRDGSGRVATATRTVGVQNATPPPPPPGTISVYITEPRNAATVSGTVWFTIWIENAAFGSKTYTLSVGGRTVGTTMTDSNGPVSIPWVTTASDNGPRTPTVGVRDSAGATGSGSISVTVAN